MYIKIYELLSFLDFFLFFDTCDKEEVYYRGQGYSVYMKSLAYL